jgi:hypothetical protein
MERSRRLVMGALLVAMVRALLASSPATAAEHDGPDERAAARLDAIQRQDQRAQSLGQRQDQRDQAREDWQKYGKNQQQNRQEFADNYYDDHGTYYGGYAGAVAAGAAVGAAAGAAAAYLPGWTQACTPTAVTVGSTTYYQCDSAWYMRHTATARWPTS